MNRVFRGIKLSVIVAMMFPLLTACWDRLEIEERAVVLGISVDAASKETEKEEDEISHITAGFPEPAKGMIRITVQIALPGKIPLGPGESGGGGKGGAEQTVWVISMVGHTMDDALMNLQQQISGRIFFGHLRVIVVSEELAKIGMQNINDYLRRNPEVRRMAWMLVSKGKAERLMRAAPELERVPALYLMSTMDNSVKLGKFPVNYVGMYWSNSAKKGQEGYLPYVELKKKQNIEVKGLAYFKEDKLVGTTKPFEIAAYMAIKGMNPAGYRGVIKVDGSSNTVTVYATSRKSKFSVKTVNGRPKITVSIFTEINLEEKVNEQFYVSNSKILKEIEETNKKSLKKSTESLIGKLQEEGVDIFGFGEYIRAKKPSYWNSQVKTNEKWHERFRELEVEVRVNSKIRRIGMKAK
ncbi:Ger(x)C family spore germination protein [Cohnella cholangitidis]|uniref:Ger(X)C family spore germination protein n=1 Tax=Cohnella cholangitidis TaxID=2598458 RepID=A0A7G5C6X5_9BACL|nr:Ger(x)C family spore germination protein [Cohnella cholangitidis]